MEYINIDLLKLFLEWGAYAVGFGMLLVIPLELLLYGIVNVFRLVKNIVKI